MPWPSVVDVWSFWKLLAIYWGVCNNKVSDVLLPRILLGEHEMTRDDWICPVCGETMYVINSKSKYMVCIAGHGKLHPRPGLLDLPRACRINQRDYVMTPHLAGQNYVYRYVPHGHAAALEKAPREGEVVASVAFRGHRAVRLFRQKGT